LFPFFSLISFSVMERRERMVEAVQRTPCPQVPVDSVVLFALFSKEQDEGSSKLFESLEERSGWEKLRTSSPVVALSAGIRRNSWT
jgi:hypothetical protein